MAIVEGRGLFWWADETVPDGHFAPDSCVSGVVTIENDGKISLDLDGYLPSEHGPMSALLQMPVPEAKMIRGVLKGSGEHVLLIGLTFNGGQMRTNGISFERYAASECLVCETSPIPEKLCFDSLLIPLSGYEEWLGLGSIQASRTSRMVSAKYKRRKKAEYRLASSRLLKKQRVWNSIPSWGGFLKVAGAKSPAALFFPFMRQAVWAAGQDCRRPG
jgi:hypothetical protein